VPLDTLHKGGRSEPNDIDEMESISNRTIGGGGMQRSLMQTRNIPPMADSLEPSKPGSVVNGGFSMAGPPLN
jgi:hypothetical protein